MILWRNSRESLVPSSFSLRTGSRRGTKKISASAKQKNSESKAIRAGILASFGLTGSLFAGQSSLRSLSSKDSRYEEIPSEGWCCFYEVIFGSFVVVVVVVVIIVLFNLCYCRRTFKQNLYTVCDLALGLLTNKVLIITLCTGKSVSLYHLIDCHAVLCSMLWSVAWQAMTKIWFIPVAVVIHCDIFTYL